jgi:hypothetical protein
MNATSSVYRNCSVTVGASLGRFHWEYDSGSFVTYSMDSYATSDEAMAAARAEIDAEAVNA